MHMPAAIPQALPPLTPVIRKRNLLAEHQILPLQPLEAPSPMRKENVANAKNSASIALRQITWSTSAPMFRINPTRRQQVVLRIRSRLMSKQKTLKRLERARRTLEPISDRIRFSPRL